MRALIAVKINIHVLGYLLERETSMESHTHTHTHTYTHTHTIIYIYIYIYIVVCVRVVRYIAIYI